MRGGTENEAEEHGGAASGERRPSVVTLQNMLKKVSQSPFQQQSQVPVSKTADSSGSSVSVSQSQQDGERLSNLSAAATDRMDNHQLHLSQNGLNGGLASSNPFYTYYLESGNNGSKTPEEVIHDNIFVPPPEFQSSPLDLHPDTEDVENDAELPRDVFEALTRPLPPARKPSSNGHFKDVTVNSSDLFKPIPPPKRNLSKTLPSENSDLFKNEGFSLFQAAKGEDLLHAEGTKEVDLSDKPPSWYVDPFKSAPNKEDDLFRSPQPSMALDTATTKGADLFQANPTKSGEIKQNPFAKDDLSSLKENLDVFSSSVDPFGSPIKRDLLQDVSSSGDPFGSLKQDDPFRDVSKGKSYIFQPLPSEINSKDVFGNASSDAASKATCSTPSLSSQSETRLDLQSSPDFLKATPSESQPDVQAKSSDKPNGILQPTPFSRARNLSMTPGQASAEMTHVQTFKRPPRPLPRTRPPRKAKPPRPDKPPKPERPPPPVKHIEPEPDVTKTSPKLKTSPGRPPKPVLPHKLKSLGSKPVEPDTFALFEDVLLIGQEKCVEDWPEDSPELNPDFKPSGTLRLRRESLKKKGDSDGGSGDDPDGSGIQGKKKDKKFRLSRISRRGSKEKFPDDSKEGRSQTLPSSRKSSKEYFSEHHMSAEENDEEEHNGLDYKKKHLKTKVNQLLRRASTTSSVPEGKHLNGHLPPEFKDDDINKKITKKNSIIRRWSEGTVLDDGYGEEEEEEEDEEGGAQHDEADSNGFKKRKKVKIRFVPQRGFTISLEKGAHGHTARKNSKDKSQEELLGAHGYTPRKKSQDDAYDDVEEMKSFSLQSASKAAFMDDEHLQKPRRSSAGLHGDEDLCGTEDCKPKKPSKIKALQKSRRSSKEDMLDYNSYQKKKSSFSADELNDDDCLKSCRADPEEEFTQEETGKEMFDSDDDLETCKQKESWKRKGVKKGKAKKEPTEPEFEDPPGAASGDFLSEAAKAEWLAAQMDGRAMEDMDDSDMDGDTDSLMEWWNTVEQWDEVPSDDEEKVLKEDESKSFTILADKVQRGLRVFNKIFTERAEVLWQSIITLHAIADDISNFHHKAKIAGITGGTTTAVGSVAAIAGLALAPVTLGVSLVITAVGVGVATAGGITSASAAISDNVNNMHDRKKLEIVLQDYEGHLLAIGRILHFVNQGLYRLRGHPFLRSGTQHYSEDWEIRSAVQMISLVDTPVMRGTEITDEAVAMLQGLFQGMDKYFIKESRELKKGCRKEVVAQIKEVATVLNDGIVALNAIREELQDATGNV